MTQTLLDYTDALIVVAFIVAVLALIAYVWRAERGRMPRH